MVLRYLDASETDFKLSIGRTRPIRHANMEPESIKLADLKRLGIKIVDFSNGGVGDFVRVHNDSETESASCVCGAKRGNCPFENCGLFESSNFTQWRHEGTSRNINFYASDSLLSLHEAYGEKRAARMWRVRQRKNKKGIIHSATSTDSITGESEVEGKVKPTQTQTRMKMKTTTNQCRDCAQTFVTYMKLVYHVRNKHPKLAQQMKTERIRSRTCQKCSKLFNNKVSADYHMSRNVCERNPEIEDSNQNLKFRNQSLKVVKSKHDRQHMKNHERVNSTRLKRDRSSRVSQLSKLPQERKISKRLKTTSSAQELSPYQMHTTYDVKNAASEISPKMSKSGRLIKPKVSFDTMVKDSVNLYTMKKRKVKAKRT